MPAAFDLLIMAGWLYFMSRAYRMAQASVISPFEYASLPLNIFWGHIIWAEVTLAGAALALFSGLYVLYREKQERV